MDAETSLPRWGQLSYASFDLGHGTRGGWQLKERSGGLLDQEFAALQSRIVTQFDPVVAPNDFPGSAEIAAMPRRFTHVRDESGQGRYWHAVMAGADTSGRPGNVFSHVLVDRNPENASPGIRPIQWWNSPELLRPYGAEQVNGAKLPVFSAGAFAPGLGASSVLDFLFAQNVWRAGVLAVLLDAVSGAMRGGPGVVLVADSTNNAALWTAAVSFLCSPHFARQLNFSLFERAASLETVFARGVHLACVPREDAPLLGELSGIVILDEAETPNMGDVGGHPHTTAAGSTISATYWGTLAQDAVASRETTQEVMAELDHVSARLGETGADPSWPLALTAVRQPHIFADAAAEAVVVLKMSSPPSLRNDGELLAQTLAAISASGSVHAQDAWNELFRGETSELVRETLVQTYLERALSDVDWLELPGRVPLPEDYRVEVNTASLKALARSTILGLRTRLAEQSSRQSVLTAPGVLDFVASCQLIDLSAGADAELADATEEIIERVIGAVIDFDDEAQALAEMNGPLRSGDVARRFLDGVARTGRFEQSLPGNRMPAVFRDWLFPGVPQAVVPQELSRNGMKLDPMIVEVALWRCVNGQGAVDKARVVAAVGLMETFSGTQEPELLPQLLFNQATAWNGEELWLVEKRCPKELPGELFYSVLLEEPWSQGLAELCKLVSMRGVQDITPLEAELANLRRASEDQAPGVAGLAHSWVQGSPDVVYEKAVMFVRTLDNALTGLGRMLGPGSVSALLVVATVIVLGSDKPFGPWPHALKQQLSSLGRMADPGIANALGRCVETSCLSIADAEHLGRIALYIQPGFPVGAGLEGRYLGGIRVPLNGSYVPVLEVPLRKVLATMPLYDLDGAAAATLEVIREGLPETESDRQREKAFQKREKMFSVWWHQLCTESGRMAAEQDRPAFRESIKSIKSALWKDR